MLPALSLAQDARDYQQYTREVVAASTFIAKGTINPESIPYGEKMAAAFRIFDAVQRIRGRDRFLEEFNARYGGSNSDAERISAYAKENVTFAREVANQEVEDLAAYCTDLRNRAQPLAPTEMASRFNEIEDERLARFEDHYRSVLAELDPQTRANLLSQVETTVVPGLTYGRIDYERLVAEGRDFFEVFVNGRCSEARDGEPSKGQATSADFPMPGR